jgi:holo-[acyl-carrier-protein] synthase
MQALGTGWTDEFDWKDIEVTALASGAPDVRLSGNVLMLAQSIPAGKIHLSISHTSHVALAQAVIERSS